MLVRMRPIKLKPPENQISIPTSSVDSKKSKIRYKNRLVGWQPFLCLRIILFDSINLRNQVHGNQNNLNYFLNQQQCNYLETCTTLFIYLNNSILEVQMNLSIVCSLFSTSQASIAIMRS